MQSNYPEPQTRIIDLSVGQFQNLFQDLFSEAISNALKQLPKEDRKEKTYLTRKQLRDNYGVSFSTQHNWRKDGILPRSKTGGKILYDQDLIEHILSQKNNNKKR